MIQRFKMEKVTDEEKTLLIMKDKLELVINRTERPNSYEFGKAGNRFKLYFDTVEDLEARIKKLIDSGLYIKE